MANYVLINRVELNTSAASVTFDNIPQSGYTDLKIVASLRGTTNVAAQIIILYYNNDTTASNYSRRRLLGDGSSASSASGADSEIAITQGGNATANTFSNMEIYIPNYIGSTNKSASIDFVNENNATTEIMGLYSLLWNNTSAINNVRLTANGGSFVANSTFSLYGVAALGTTPTVAPKATGGNIVANDGTYWYHAFLSSGTFTPQTALNCTVLAVGGGGGGGGLGSSGGGGGVIPSSSLAFATSNYAITIGSGGSGVAAGDLSTNGGRGNDTIVNYNGGSITAYGGGGGLAYSPAADSTSKNGGSGGGGGGSSSQYSGGTGVAGQGYAGGNSLNNADIRGGGGGGYSGAGGNATSSTGGNGGQGYNLPSALQAVVPGNTYVGSGAGGPCRASVGTNGTSGTGAGVPTNNGTNASAPTMFGCAGAATGQSAGSQPFGAASAGYSGLVIIRYSMA